MRQTRFDAVIESVAAKAENENVLSAIRRDKRLEGIPVVGLVDRVEHLQGSASHCKDYDARLMRSGRQELLATVNRLTGSEMKQQEPLLEVA